MFGILNTRWKMKSNAESQRMLGHAKRYVLLSNHVKPILAF